jgi:broad specificity phosphatase PhoE
MGLLWSAFSRTAASHESLDDAAATMSATRSLSSSTEAKTASPGPILRFFAPRPTAHGGQLVDAYLVLLRHGERMDHAHPGWLKTVSSRQEGLDPPLSPRGAEQAATLATWWKRKMNAKGVRSGQYDVTCVVTSPLRRCVETSKPLAEALEVPLYVHAAATDALTRRVYKVAAPRVDIVATGVPEWPFDKANRHATNVPKYPEDPAQFDARCAALVASTVDALLQAAATSVEAGSVGAGQMRVAEAQLLAHSERHLAATAPRESAHRRCVRIVVVTHADVIASALQHLCPRDKRSELGQPSVSYASLTTLHRNATTGEWALVTRGSTDAIGNTRVDVIV